MKRNRLLFIVTCMLYVTMAMSKTSYYYYNGERIPLTLSDDSVKIYYAVSDTLRGDDYHLNYSTKVVSMEDKKMFSDSSYTSVEYIIKGGNDRTYKMSNRFYVQLFDTITGKVTLRMIAQKTNVIVVGKVANTSDWYELIVHNSYMGNSLDMSNYFYETGVFKNVDPGFIFNYTPSCVSDSHYSYQWGLPVINACDAWNITKGSPNVKIAIIDQGVYTQHSEFYSIVFEEPYDCYAGSAVSNVYGGHGTNVCGVIAADHNSGEIAGIAPECKIMPISHPLQANENSSAQLASGFYWAMLHGADVISCSWGDQGGALYDDMHSSILETAISDAINSGRNGKGCVVVFAAGNYNSSLVDYPAYSHPDIITVGSINSSLIKSYFSSYGTALDVVAPGESIYTSEAPNDYIFTSGTSFSAPYVSGIAGLILSVNPNLTQKDVADIIDSTAQKVGNYSYTTHSAHPNGTWNNEMGYGLVDAYAALVSARYIQGPKYICDTAKYHLVYPLQPGEVVSWSVHNGQMFNPYYSIVGPTNQDTVIIAYTDVNWLRGEEETRDPFNPGIDNQKYLSATIYNGSITREYKKDLLQSASEVPTISVSNSNPSWQGGTQRTFTVTNCLFVPDSLLQWTFKITTQRPRVRPHTTTHIWTGRSKAYMPINPPLQATTTIDVSVMNLSDQCGQVSSDTLHFIVVRQTSLNASLGNGDQLNIKIIDGDDEPNRGAYRLSEDNNYSFELWHSFYGRMRTQPAYNSIEQMSISDLPQGVYVLLLKENDNVIAETKVQIQ